MQTDTWFPYHFQKYWDSSLCIHMPVYLGKDSDVTSVRVNNCSIVVWACTTWLKKTEITVRQKSCSYEVAPSLPLKCCCLDCFFLYYFADNKKTSEVTEAVNEHGIEKIKTSQFILKGDSQYICVSHESQSLWAKQLI